MNLIMKYFTVLIVTLFFSSCAKNEIKPEPVYIPVAIKQCNKTERDLVKPWPDRKYWCAEKNRKDTVKKHNHIIDLESIHKARLEVISVNQSNKELAKIRAEKLIVNEKKSLALEKKLEEKTKTKKIQRVKNHAFNVENKKVGFANHREVLGPKGRIAIKTIAIAASNASHIKLRGFLAKEEALAEWGKTHEQFSVGRALSVKSQLIKHGISESKITILHHRKIRPGAFVEVIFNG